MKILEAKNFQRLMDALLARGYTLIGPSLRDVTIALEEVSKVDDLPRGWTMAQGPAACTLEKRADDALFGYTVGAYSWKKFLYPPRVRLFTALKAGKGFEIVPGDQGPQHARTKLAFLGVRSCELHAIEIQDKIFSGGQFVDRDYKSARDAAFIVVVNCVETGGTCFCVSMGTGPKASGGYDLALTELIGEGYHRFVVDAGSGAGQEVLAALALQDAGDDDSANAEAGIAAAAGSMGRKLDTENLKELLYNNFEHHEWTEVAKRCLACTNCTLVCPTCFCSTVEDITDLEGSRAERWRRWDSCFTLDFARVAGGNNRPSVRARYRQWMTHKLAYWIDQFGTSGCVGCGRCITWCPVGIDITEEAERIRNTDSSHTAGAAVQHINA